MNKHSEDIPDWEAQRNRIIGLGESSIRKSYYPELQKRIEELERKNRELQVTYAEQTAVGEELRQQIDETGRKEQLLLSSEERYRSLFDTMHDCVVVYQAVDDGNDFIIREMNAAAQKTEQIARDEVIGRRVTEVFPGVGDFGILAVFRRVFSTGTSEEFPLSFYRDNRISGWRENFIYKLPSGEVVADYRDVTEQKRVQEEVRASGERFRQLIESSPVPIMLARDGVFQYCNPAFCHMMGYSRSGELEGRSLLDFIAPEYHDRITGYISARSRGEPAATHYEAVGIRKDGSRFPYEITVATIGLTDGPVSIAYVTDITKRKAAEDALLRSEKKFRDIVETTPDLIWEIDPFGKFTFASSQIQETLGYSPEEITSKSFTDLVRQADLPELQQIFRGQVLNRTHLLTLEVSAVHHDGHIVELEIRSGILLDPAGNLTGLRGIARDITERKRTEKALQMSSSRLRRAELIAGIGHWEFHMDSREVMASDGARIIYGLSGDRWTIPDVQKVPLPEYRENLDDALKALITENRPYDVEFRIQRPADGKILDIHSIAEYDPADHIVFGVIQDVTERKRAEATLRESESFLSGIVENLPLMLFVKDAGDLRFLRFNRAGEELIGYPRSDLLGKNDHDLFPGEQADFFTTKDRHVLEEKVPVDIPEERIQTRNLGQRVLHTRKIPILSESGEARFLLGISEDITDRKAAEEALRESEERYRSLVDITETGYLVLDDHGRVIDANDVYVRLTGRASLDELIGRQVTEWTAPHDIERNIREVERCMKTGNVRGFEIDYLHPDGTVQPIEINATVFHRDTGDIILTLCRDISERRRTNVALQQARNKLNLLNAVTFQDIQTAAFSLSAYQELIKTLMTDQKSKAYVEKQEMFLKKMVETLEFAKNYQEMGIHPPRWQNVHQVFLYAISHLDFLKVKQDIRVGNLEIFADPLFEKALFNIMENVLVHGMRATEVRFSSFEESDHLVLVIEDNGIGIPQAEKNMIFDRGYGKGTGLGLFLVREVLSITGMAIRETGIPGQGTRFEISVPGGVFRIPQVSTPKG